MKFELLIADAIDTLANGKLAAVGIYADKVLLVQVGDEDFGRQVQYMLNLTAAITVMGAEPGEHKFDIALLAPGEEGEGKVLVRDATYEAEKGASANFLVAVSPFAGTQFGEYKFVVNFDGQKYTLPFEIRRGRQSS